jgi:hypothetical protein
LIPGFRAPPPEDDAEAGCALGSAPNPSRTYVGVVAAGAALLFAAVVEEAEEVVLGVEAAAGVKEFSGVATLAAATSRS